MVSDKRADTLAKMAASATDPAKFDSAAKMLRLLVSPLSVDEGQPAMYLTHVVPSASAWAFGGAKIGESSDLFDDEQGYYLVRLDSLSAGRRAAARGGEGRGTRSSSRTQKAVDALMPKAKAFATAAAGSSLEAAAKAQGLTVEKVGPVRAQHAGAGARHAQSEAVGAAVRARARRWAPSARRSRPTTAVYVHSRGQADQRGLERSGWRRSRRSATSSRGHCGTSGSGCTSRRSRSRRRSTICGRQLQAAQRRASSVARAQRRSAGRRQTTPTEGPADVIAGPCVVPRVSGASRLSSRCRR